MTNERQALNRQLAQMLKGGSVFVFRSFILVVFVLVIGR